MQNQSKTADDNYQELILQDVSRTFALTIPQLPPALRKIVSNAYLLCRIADTIEDDNALTPEQTRQFSDMFIDVVAGKISSETFSEKLYPLLSGHTIQAEHDLIKNAPSVLRITHSFNVNQRKAMERCIRIMAKGMADYQDSESLEGLESLSAMDEYCYYVAGVVGEMLTELFCEYSLEINQKKNTLMQLAVSFGEGLQMTNILKDIWEDRQRGACWLPRDIFASVGIDLGKLTPGNNDVRFANGLGILIGVTKTHLRNALEYTLLIPRQETGIRRFCLWAIGMAILTLNKLNQNRRFSHGNEVKITRRSVKATVLVTSILARYNRALILLFKLFSRNLPKADIREKLDKINCTAL